MVLQFWRTSSAVRLNRRCILFLVRGITYKILAHCGLHCLDLGVVSRYIAFCLWVLILADIWDLPASTADEMAAIGLMRLRSELWCHFSEQRKLNPGASFSEVHDLSVGMIGSRETPAMHRCGGAEIRNLLP